MNAIFSFSSTRDAIRAERLLLEAGETSRVMPRPGAIAAGCGICLRIPVERRAPVWELLRREGIDAEAVHLPLEGGYRLFPPPLFSNALGLAAGDVVALVGCGGKTALANRLAMENRHLPVLLSTTTSIHMPSDMVIDRLAAQEETLPPGVTLVCGEIGDKLRGVSADVLERLCPVDGVTLVEADGSRGLPLKGWAAHEPVIPPRTVMTVGVCVLWPVGMAFSEERAHRPELFRQTTGIREGDILGVDHMEAMIREMFASAVGRKAFFFNQVESNAQEDHAAALAARLGGDMRVVAGSVREGRVRRLDGLNHE